MAPELSTLNQRFVAEALAEGIFPSREALLDRAIDLLRLSLDFDELPQPAHQATALQGTAAEPAAAGAEPMREVVDDEDRKHRLEAWDSDSWDSDAVMRRIFESLAEAGVRTND